MMAFVRVLAALLAWPLPESKNREAGFGGSCPTRLFEETVSMRDGTTATSGFSYSFGPGPLTPAIKAICRRQRRRIPARLVVPRASGVPLSISSVCVPRPWLGGCSSGSSPPTFPAWRRVSTCSSTAGAVDVRRRAGADVGDQLFAKYYAITGIGAGICVVLVALTPIGDASYVIPTVAHPELYGACSRSRSTFRIGRSALPAGPRPGEVLRDHHGGIAFLRLRTGRQRRFARRPSRRAGGRYLYLKGGGTTCSQRFSTAT